MKYGEYCDPVGAEKVLVRWRGLMGREASLLPTVSILSARDSLGDAAAGAEAGAAWAADCCMIRRCGLRGGSERASAD